MKKSPERYILAAALALLAITAAALAYFFPSTDDIQKASGQIKPNATKLTADYVQSQLATWNKNPVWDAPANKHQLMISDPYLFYATLYPNGNYLQKDDGTARTAGGVLISWYRMYHLNFQDPNIDYEDPDGDGFSNKIEFMNEAARADACDGTLSTNPIDAKSHPTYISRLRLEKFEARPFLVEFRGYSESGGVMKFQIYMKDLSPYQQPGLKKEGDDLGYEGYRIGKFTQKTESVLNPATGSKSDVDVSTLELVKNDIGTSVVLPYKKEIPAPEFNAVFVMLMPGENGKELSVPRAKTFVLSYEPNTTYLLLDAKDDGAKVRNIATGKEYNIPRLDPAEWDDVPVAADAAATPGAH